MYMLDPWLAHNPFDEGLLAKAFYSLCRAVQLIKVLFSFVIQPAGLCPPGRLNLKTASTGPKLAQHTDEAQEGRVSIYKARLLTEKLR